MKSRFIHTSRRKSLRHSKSKKVWGAFEDRGKYIRCWNCGFYIDLSRRSVTGPGHGNVYTEYIVPSPGTRLSDEDTTIYMRALDTAMALPKDYGQDYYTPRKSYATGGCPFCGCMNLP